jgi:RNA polymerase sigma factor (sigma-70 family)
MNWTIFHEQVFPMRHKLYRFALRITGSTHEAEDVVQEVLEKVWKTDGEQSEKVQNWEAWCMTLTRNRSLDKARSQSAKRTDGMDGLASLSSDSLSPAHQAEQKDMADHIRQIMQSLPDKQRIVMHLRDIEELSYDEIAEVVGITMDQVKVNLHRARKAVRERLIQL